MPSAAVGGVTGFRLSMISRPAGPLNNLGVFAVDNFYSIITSPM